MKQITTLLVLLLFITVLFAQNTVKGDANTLQNTVVRLDRSPNNWAKGENESAVVANSIISGNENVSFSATANGIYITIINGTNKIKLFALTGQLLLNGDLTQGKFFIPTKQGIYFLRINNKSFKVICK